MLHITSMRRVQMDELTLFRSELELLYCRAKREIGEFDVQVTVHREKFL